MSVLGFLWIASHLASVVSSPAFSDPAGAASRVVHHLTHTSLVLQASADVEVMASALPISTERRHVNRHDEANPIKLTARLDLWTQELRKVVETDFLNVSVVRPTAGREATNVNDESVTQLAAVASSQVACLTPQALLKSNRDRPDQFQVRIENHMIAEVPTEALATALADQIKQLLSDLSFDPAALQPVVIAGYPGATLNNQLVLHVNHEDIKALNRPVDVVAIAWVNNLRNALGTASLPMAEAQAAAHSLAATGQQFEGIASWYGPYFHGRLTANGERFNQNELTAAHPSLPFNTYLRVTNLKNDHTIVVRINDRGPYIGKRSLDLSRRAAICLGSETAGVVPYRATIMQAAPMPVVDAIASTNEAPSDSSTASSANNEALRLAQR